MLGLSVRGLEVSAADGRRLLGIETLEVPAGSSLGIRGPSGAGKTTLIHAIAGLLGTARGEVRWGDTDLLALPEGRRDAFRLGHLGLIFQDFLLFEELSALENAAVSAAYVPRARRAPLRARAARLLEDLGIGAGHARVDRFSGGERQRVAVARALAPDPAVILADEPTASLDRANADRLVDDLVALSREGGRTLVAISHDPAVTGAMDRTVEIVDGRLAP